LEFEEINEEVKTRTSLALFFFGENSQEINQSK